MCISFTAPHLRLDMSWRLVQFSGCSERNDELLRHETTNRMAISVWRSKPAMICTRSCTTCHLVRFGTAGPAAGGATPRTATAAPALSAVPPRPAAAHRRPGTSVIEAPTCRSPAGTSGQSSPSSPALCSPRRSVLKSDMVWLLSVVAHRAVKAVFCKATPC